MIIQDYGLIQKYHWQEPDPLQISGKIMTQVSTYIFLYLSQTHNYTCIDSAKADDIELHQMDDEQDAAEGIKQFDAMHTPNEEDTEESSSPTRKRNNQGEGKTLNYFSMNDDEIENVSSSSIIINTTLQDSGILIFL